MWVSEFVEALKTELESTFKEEISVYFDINPHDGLLETHDVDESLKDKLKCLIFIPIISRTYCDPKSFAWEHEFKAFVKQASQDKYGLKVKLFNGNIASRVLPVQIHDLDKGDALLCESVLGSVLRGIEFIYKEAGVDKPLSPDDDEKRNLNNTKYIIQIVKVAHAIKDIITAIQHYNQQQDKITKEVYKPVSTPHKNKKTPIIITSVAVFALIVLGILFIPKVFKTSENLEKSIAVLPFKNDSPDQEMYFINGVMEEILNNMCKIEDLRVVSRSSVEQYRDEPKPIPVVAEEMDVSYVLEGSGQRDGDNIRLTVQLLNGKKDQHIWSETYYRKIKNIFELQSEIAQTIASELKAIITPEEKKLIEKVPTTNLTAYDFYQRGNEELFSGSSEKSLVRAEQLFNESLRYDPTYAEAYVGLAWTYWNKHLWKSVFEEDYMDSVRILADKALSIDDKLSNANTIRGYYYNQVGDFPRAIKEFNRAVELNPNNFMAYMLGARLYANQDLVKSIQYYHKALALHRGEQLPSMLSNQGWEYQGAGFIEKAKYYYSEAFKLTKDSLSYYRSMGLCEYYSGNLSDAIEYGEKYYALDSTDANILYIFGEGFMMIGDYVQSLKYFKKWLEGSQSLISGSVYGMHRVGWAYWMNGMKEEGEAYFRKQIDYCNRILEMGHVLETTSRNYYDLAATYAFTGEMEKAYDNLRKFAKSPILKRNYIMYITNDPLFNSIRNEPEFQKIARDVETKYQAEHERVRKWLEENNML